MSAGGVHPQVRLVIQPYGSALPLGFFAFGIGMFLYAAQGAPWLPVDQTKSPIFALACHGGLAFLLEDAPGRAVLPVGPTGASREAIEGDLSAQLRRLDSEEGVRPAL